MTEVIGGKQLAVLQAIFRLSSNAYGVSIGSMLASDGQPTSLPQIYLALDRLVEKGFAEARMGEPTAERGGRRKRLYTITGKGYRVLTSSLAQDPRIQVRGGWVPTGDESLI